MSNESRDQAVERAVASLGEREAHAYRVWCGTDRPPLAPTLNARLFALYLNGKGCEEIRRLNPHISLGEIVAAKVQGDWDRRKAEYLDSLLTSTTARVAQASAETIDLLCDLLAVASREHGDKLRRYLQHGDAADLPEDFRIGSLKALREAVETLHKLTGQEKASTKVAVEVVAPAASQAAPRQPTPAEAGDQLKVLLGTKK